MHKVTAFVDESGDLGSGRSSSKYFTMSAVITENPKSLERIVKQTRVRNLRRKKQRTAELKFHGSDEGIRLAVLGKLASLEEAKVFSVSVHKQAGTRAEGLDGLHTYVRVLGALASDMILSERATRQFQFILDYRPFERAIGSAFDALFLDEIRIAMENLRMIRPAIQVSRFDSLNSTGLQVADFVAGAIRRKHELGDETYYRLVVPIMVMEMIITISR